MNKSISEQFNKVIVNDWTSRERLFRLAANPENILDVTNLDLSRLPDQVSASLYTKAKRFYAPKLVSVRNIDAEEVVYFSAPELIEARNLILDNATDITAPLLINAGIIRANNARKLELEHLQVAGDIRAERAEILSMPRLKMAGDIGVPKATNIYAPQLKNCGLFTVSKEMARQIEANRVQTAKPNLKLKK